MCSTRLKKQDLSYIYLKKLNQLNLIYFYIFTFVTDQELCVCELMSHIMGYEHSLSQKDILKPVYYFIILFLIYL
jgi:hypothetical protein